MFRIKDTSKLEEMGFSKNDISGDYEIKKLVKDNYKLLFKIYRGSPYIRNARTGYIIDEQMRLIHEWTKKDYIYWEG